MAALADTLDLEARWRPLSDAELTQAETLLDDASDMIRDRWPEVDANIANGSLRESSVVRIVANMVKRAMIIGTSAAADGVESQTQTAGPFAVSNKFASPSDSLYISDKDALLFDGALSPRMRLGWLA